MIAQKISDNIIRWNALMDELFKCPSYPRTTGYLSGKELAIISDLDICNQEFRELRKLHGEN